MKHILIPVDGSQCSYRAVEQGKIMADAFAAQVTLLYVVGQLEGGLMTNAAPLVHKTLDEEKAKAEELLADAAGRFSKEVGRKVLVGGIPESIVRAVKDGDYDFVIMGTEGMGSALKRLIMGSVTKHVLEHVEVPVLVVN